MPIPGYPTENPAMPDPGMAPSTAALDREGWPEIEPALLQQAHGPAPAFPLDLLPLRWRDWVGDTARLAGVPTGYVAQAVLGAVSGVCGAGVMARVSPAWSEPLVLWQAVVGGPSSGKSLALAAGRGLLAPVEAALAAIAVGDATAAALGDALRGHPRGAVLWRDGVSAWLGDPAGATRGGLGPDHWLQAWAAGPVTMGRLHLERFPVGILGTLPADRLADGLREIGDELAARFLYAWPDPPSYCPLGERRAARDDFARAAILRIATAAGTVERPLLLQLDDGALACFDRFLAGLHRELHRAEGLEAAWLGKGRSTVARLAAALSMLAWSCETGPDGPAGHILGEQVEAAVRLWSGYFRPHARTVLDRDEPSAGDQRIRRVVRWLHKEGATLVSLEDLRLSALGRTADAFEVEGVIRRLEEGGVLLHADAKAWRGRGRPARRWRVNPVLASSQASAGNTGNTGNSSSVS